jgi:uncharacterized protein
VLAIIALLLAAESATLSNEVAVSPAVKALARKYAPNVTAEFETELEALEKGGDASAAALLGELLMMPNRQGGPDFVRSCDHSEAAGRYPEGLQNLATCYFRGQGRSRDLGKARDLYHQAADQGYAQAACAYGNMLIAGQGGPIDIPRGLDLCRRAADAGIPDAQTDYGIYLLTGKYTARDPATARHYLSLAANQGQANAAFLLGQIYWNGDGVDKNGPDAALWWIRAYDGGRKDAPFLIGTAAMRIVVEGAQAKHEVPTVAIEQARKWLGIAAKEDPDAEKREKAKELLGLLDQLLGGGSKKGG